ncbi:MAG: hypothetical protein D9V47_08830 [Clostridia bacterium]|nr:MAG: hypothetical protein D9V47_08830 [Clostridia bacterium]
MAEARIKTDKVDAEILARLLAADFVCACWVASKEERELRTLLHHRAALKKQIVGVKNRIHAVLARHAITVPKLLTIIWAINSSASQQSSTWARILILPRSILGRPRESSFR